MLMNQEEIKKIIPHRDPMLLVTTVEALEPGQSIETTFYVDPNMEIFKGHFPGAPVLPGVYSCEIMAQATDIMFMVDPKYAGKAPLFLGLNFVYFRAKISPGDTLHVKAKLLNERPEKAIVSSQAEIYVGDTMCVSGEITIAMR